MDSSLSLNAQSDGKDYQISESQLVNPPPCNIQNIERLKFEKLLFFVYKLKCH